MRERKRFLDTETISNFHNGEYAVWNLQGNVIIQASPTGTGGPLISSLFFGPAGSGSTPAPPSSTSKAAFNGFDASTQGSWTGVYGGDGFLIPNGHEEQRSELCHRERNRAFGI